MEMIKNLQINNYKSIRKLELSCSRINVFIGEPNVGKSNILEALDLSYLSWLIGTNASIEAENRIRESEKREKLEKISIKDFFRVNSPADLFHLGDLKNVISIEHAGFSYGNYVRFNQQEQKNFFEWGSSNGGFTEFDNNFNPSKKTSQEQAYFASPITPYRFKDIFQPHDSGNYINNLMPPFGNNLGKVIRLQASLKKFVDELTKDYGFEFNIDTATDKMAIQYRINKGLVYTVPYHSLADTFRRILFFVAAIRTDNSHVITLEEPEAHSFPRYISLLADEIIKRSDRQFFIATHSPHLLGNLIENTPKEDLGVFVCGYDKIHFQTIAKKLTSDDLSELLDFGVDIFFNINRYLDDRVEHRS